MPKARPPLAPEPPAPLQAGEAEVIKLVICHYYGADAVIRNWGPDPTKLLLHVETSLKKHDWTRYDCLGALFTRIDRKEIDLIVTRRGWPHGSAKIAYRQGVVL